MDSQQFCYIWSELDFGPVAVDKTLIKKYHIRNIYKVPVQFTIKRCSETNPIYHVFNIDKYEALVEPRKDMILKIAYKPNVIDFKNVDYFRICDNQLNVYTIKVIGECTGPVIKCSTKYLHFMKTPSKSESEKTFELKNESNNAAVFQFDETERDLSIFQVTPLCGTIEPMKHAHITVKFVPETSGLYAKQLNCLIFRHEPILVHIFGVFTTNNKYDLEQIKFKHYPFDREELFGYGGYLNDCLKFRNSTPPVSLSENYIDFTTVSSMEPYCHVLTTNLANHLDYDIHLEWESMDVFRMNPKAVTIPAKNSALFEIKYAPLRSDTLSSSILTAQIHWQSREQDLDENIMNIPIPLTLRFIGQPSSNCKQWIPQITLFPETVILPCTLPGISTYSTFMIRSSGHLPVLYKFVPPKKTNFLLKPMMGLTKAYQIIVAQLHTNAQEKSAFIEKWALELNGDPERSIPIYIKALTDVPSLVIGCNNTVFFENVQCGSKHCMNILVRNASGCHLRFKFELNNLDSLDIQPSEGELSSNEELVSNWCLRSENEGLEEFVISCKSHAVLRNGMLTGPEYETTVKVSTTGCYSQLCAVPANLDMGDIEWGSILETEFILFNFGESEVTFNLCNNYSSKGAGERGNDFIDISPKSGKCGPKEKHPIKIRLQIVKSGSNSVEISYNSTKNDTNPGGSIKVFTITFLGVYPTIQIQDIIEHNFGEIMGKVDLWERLMIDEVNQILKTLQQSERMKINFLVPDCEVSNCTYFVVFLLKNITNIATTVHLQRKKNCDCAFKEDAKSLSFRRMTINCPHKEVASMELSDKNIKPNATAQLLLEVQYTIPHMSEMVFSLSLSNERNIQIHVMVNSIPKGAMVLSTVTLDQTIYLGEVHIGLKEPPLQAFWLYNNTSIQISYNLDVSEIDRLCRSEGAVVLKCVNTVGHVNPKTRAPLLFRFHPIEAKLHNVTAPLQLGNELIFLQLYGHGVHNVDMIGIERPVNTKIGPSSSLALICPVTLSTEYAVIDRMLVGTSVDKLFFLKNRTKDSEIQYSWSSYFLDGVIKVDALNKGVLKPRESHAVVIKITSLSEPCSIRILLTCKVLDLTKLTLHQQSLVAFQQRQKEVAEEFTITDTEVVQPKNYVEIVPAPEPFPISLAISIDVVGFLDKDSLLTLDAQSSQLPYNMLRLLPPKYKASHSDNIQGEPVVEANKFPTPSIESMNFVKDVIECLIAQSVNNKYFNELMDKLRTEPLPIYPQIKPDAIKFGPSMQALHKPQVDLTKDESFKLHHKPQVRELENIFQEAIIQGVHETFRLGAPQKPK